jgi:hypothetical protein
VTARRTPSPTAEREDFESVNMIKLLDFSDEVSGVYHQRVAE